MGRLVMESCPESICVVANPPPGQRTSSPLWQSASSLSVVTASTKIHIRWEKVLPLFQTTAIQTDTPVG